MFSAPPVAAATASIDFTSGPPANSKYTDIVNTNMRKIIAKRLTESRATVPHFFASMECEIDELMALRKTMKKVQKRFAIIKRSRVLLVNAALGMLGLTCPAYSPKENLRSCHQHSL
jgi:pyruvate/2-oxoglutarate dehydrogenase complex dihydrolipoamide acyltransferase (E2) component